MCHRNTWTKRNSDNLMHISEHVIHRLLRKLTDGWLKSPKDTLIYVILILLSKITVLMWTKQTFLCSIFYFWFFLNRCKQFFLHVTWDDSNCRVCAARAQGIDSSQSTNSTNIEHLPASTELHVPDVAMVDIRRVTVDTRCVSFGSDSKLATA